MCVPLPTPQLAPAGLGQLLLMLSGDIELNPGPQNRESINLLCKFT